MTYINPQPDGTFDLMVDKVICDITFSVLHSRHQTLEAAQKIRDELAEAKQRKNK
jgi:hypothetical protein